MNASAVMSTLRVDATRRLHGCIRNAKPDGCEATGFRQVAAQSIAGRPRPVAPNRNLIPRTYEEMSGRHALTMFAA